MVILKRLIYLALFIVIAPGCEMEPTTGLRPGESYIENDASSTNNTDSEVAYIDPQLPILERLALQQMYSTETTGAATWLYPTMYVDAAQIRLSRALIASAMEDSGAGAFPVITIYQYLHAGGIDIDAYLAWIEELAVMISEKPGDVVVVIEPDTFVYSVNDPEMQAVLDDICGIIADNAENAAVILDIGHSGWMNASEVYELVSTYENFDKIDGWASNTSNFQSMDVEEIFASGLYELTGKPVIIDTSRNGCGVPSTILNPPADEWCPGDPFAHHPDNPAILFNYYNKPYDEAD